MTLPQADFGSLQDFCFRCIQDTLLNAEIWLSTEDNRRFTRFFLAGLSSQVKTPRAAQRYSNTIAFSVPLLEREVNMADLLLIEGVKVFYPELYRSIKERAGYFLGYATEPDGNLRKTDDFLNDVIQKTVPNLHQDDQLGVKSLLIELFPHIGGIADIDGSWQEQWTQEKRIASLRYFKRYFMYGIPVDDIPDSYIESFLNTLDKYDVSSICNQIDNIINYQDINIEILIRQIFKGLDSLSPSTSQKLAQALAKMGEQLQKIGNLDYSSRLANKVGILISYLVEKIEDANDRFESCEVILQDADPIPFAIQCFECLYASADKYRDQNKEHLFSTSSVNFSAKASLLAKIIVQRIKKIAQTLAVFDVYPDDFRMVFDFWSKWGSKMEVNENLRETFTKNPYYSISFLMSYIPKDWLLEMQANQKLGKTIDKDLPKKFYDLMREKINIEMLVGFLRNIYGERLEALNFSKDSAQTIEELTARQFFYLYTESQFQMVQLPSSNDE